jgi:hypothetical protein
LGRLGGAPNGDALLQTGVAMLTRAVSGSIGSTQQALSSVDGVKIVLLHSETGKEVASATSDAAGNFVFDDVLTGTYKLQIVQDEFAAVSYSVDSGTIEVTENGTATVGLPVVSRVKLPAYPQPTVGSPLALDQASGRIYMAVDQGIEVMNPATNTLDLLYAKNGFGSELGPRVLMFVPVAKKLLIVTPDRLWFIDESVFSDDAASEVINYDDPATAAALKDTVQSTDVDTNSRISTGRNDADFDPHYYRFNATKDGKRAYVASGGHTIVVDMEQRSVARVFLTSGWMAHYSPTSNRLFFIQQPSAIRIIDAETLTEVKKFDLENEDPYKILGVSSRPSTGDGYIAFTRLNTMDEAVLFLLVVDPQGTQLQLGKAATLLGAGDARMEAGVPHWQATGDRFIVGDSLFQFDGSGFQPISTGAILDSTLTQNGVPSNKARSADVPNAILVSFLGDENAALGIYYLDGTNADTSIRVIRGRVPVVTLDEVHGRAFVFGNGALSTILYNTADAASSELTVDLRMVGKELLGGVAGAPCSSTLPCPEEDAVCAPVDEFNTDEGTCTAQVRNPFKTYCGGLNNIQCDPGFECKRSNATHPQSAGQCAARECTQGSDCPENYFCNTGGFPTGGGSTDGASMPPSDGSRPPADGSQPPAGGTEPPKDMSGCPPEDPNCAQVSGICMCMDLAICGPTCRNDAECPLGLVCSGNGHCALDRCVDDQSCPSGKICGVTEIGRGCVEPGSGTVGQSCIASTECASGYCRAGMCEQSCGRTGDCPAGKECMGGEWVGYCTTPQCGCGPEQICDPWAGFCTEGANCATNSDCTGGKVCVNSRCKSQCTQTSECAVDEVCTQGHAERPILYCANPKEGGVYCGQRDGAFPGGMPRPDGTTGGEAGCPPDKWCSNYGTCESGTPCVEWEANSCPSNQFCLGSVCQATCRRTSDCASGQECTAGKYYAQTPSGNGAVMTCQTASCNCPQPDDICVNYGYGSLGECWNMDECGTTGFCPDSENYECRNSFDGQYHCACKNGALCGPRCLVDTNCPYQHRCDQASGQCVLDTCQADADCDPGQICGIDDQLRRMCGTPGTRLPGAPCDTSTQCSTASCVWDYNTGNRTCVTPCQLTRECQAGQSCLVNKYDMAASASVVGFCGKPRSGVGCAPNEYAINEGDGCTDGTECNPNDPMHMSESQCLVHTFCQWLGSSGVCVCNDIMCQTTCTTDASCGEVGVGCLGGFCRPLPRCAVDSECDTGRVCGLLDGQEHTGTRCVTAGKGETGTSCSSHADCKGGFCNAGLCKLRCLNASECGAGQECRATLVSSKIDFVVGACQAAACGCAAGEVCNLDKACGPGALCNADDDCGADHSCVRHLCRPNCQKTSQCALGLDCTGLDAAKPHVCVPATCGCGPDEVCDSGRCFVSRPCASDGVCAGGLCIGGQCKDKCVRTTDCAGGLECVAVPVFQDPFSSYTERARVCAVTECDCRDTGTWCLPNSGSDATMTPAGGSGQGMCFLGSDCSKCQMGNLNYYCSGFYNASIRDATQGQACFCSNPAVCGPRCHADDECPDGYVCDASNACVVLACKHDSDCPTGKVCGANPTQYNLQACRVPGTKADGAECSLHSDCASGACDGGFCSTRCVNGTDCATGEVCTYGKNPAGFDIAMCVANAKSTCTSGCGKDQWCDEGQCRNGTSCRYNWNNCASTEICDGYSCQRRCGKAEDCASTETCSYGVSGVDYSSAVCVTTSAASCAGGCGAGQWCYYGTCYTDQACFFNNGICGAGRVCDGVRCRTACKSTEACGASEVCAYDVGGANRDSGVCMPKDKTGCAGGCAGAEWCYNSKCSFGTACMYDYSVCGAGKICDYLKCQQACKTTGECASGDTCTFGLSSTDYNVAQCAPTPQSGCPGGCGAGQWCYSGQCYGGTPCMYTNVCGAGEVCDTTCLKSCKGSLECPLGQECILLDPWTGDPANAPAACKPEECHCRKDQDRCRSDKKYGGYFRECFRPVTCNFTSPCNTSSGPEYFCEQGSAVCKCNDLNLCGPTCTSSQECPLEQICDAGTQQCTTKRCQRDSECPSGTACVFNGYNRICSMTGSVPDGGDCNNWNECKSGMCYQRICVNPCVDNGDCGGAGTCQQYQQYEYTFCFNWDPKCACGVNQYCDHLKVCQSGPSCVDSSDCQPGMYCNGYNRVCSF